MCCKMHVTFVLRKLSLLLLDIQFLEDMKRSLIKIWTVCCELKQARKILISIGKWSETHPMVIKSHGISKLGGHKITSLLYQ